ncbi:MAG: carboxypeptidase-like regulatory domain-containing protein, partial [Planctomycetota bacterium]|nr:carboxypeptidase-like regulatory domain-containing protein [Planctomycetota bacterium]
MNTAAKAALLSVGLIVLIVLGYVVFSGGDDPGFIFTGRGDGRTPDGGSRGELSPRAGTIGALSPPRQRGSIEVHVSIVDGGNKRPLSRSTLRVVRRTESQNLGDTVLALPRAGARGGDFDFQLEPGYYQLFARARGFVGFSKEVTLVEGQSPGSYVFELDRGISIAGRVLSVEGTPISGASVYAFQKLAAPDADLEELLRNMVDLEEMSRVTEHPSDVSADDGSYEIFGLELGNWYTVRAVADGFSPGENASVPAPSERVDIHLRTGGVVEGLVRSTEGGPVEGAVVEAYQELEKSAGLFAIILAKARPPVDSATADASGRYVLEKMGSGLFNFRVTAPGYQVHEALKLRVNPGQTSLRDFLLRRGNVLQGIVRGPNHQPLVGAKVRVSQIGGDFGRRDTVSIRFQDDGIATDDQGFFLFDTLREGKYTLLAWHRDYQSVQRRDVYPSEDDEITVTLGVGGQLQGRVYDMDSGEPIAGARISASDRANLRKEDVTNENGEYVLYGLNTSRPNLTVNVRATGFGRAKKEVRVSASQVVTQDFELIGSGQITGRIVTSEGDPVPGARVEVRRMGEATAQVIGHSVAESDGTFTVSDVEVGDALRVRVKKKTYLEAYTDEFDLRSGQELDLGDVALSIGGAVEGFVRDEGGQAVVGAMVTARRLGKDNLLGRGGLAVQTGADGGYRIQGLETGSVDLEFKASGFVDQVKARVKVLVGQ